MADLKPDKWTYLAALSTRVRDMPAIDPATSPELYAELAAAFVTIIPGLIKAARFGKEMEEKGVRLIRRCADLQVAIMQIKSELARLEEALSTPAVGIIKGIVNTVNLDHPLAASHEEGQKEKP